MKDQFWAGLGSWAVLVKKKVWDCSWATFERSFFMFSWAKNKFDFFFELFLAGNQSNHQNLVPSMQTYIFWLIFMGMKQRKKNQNGRLKKTEFFNSANSQYFSLVYSRVLGSKLVHSFFLLQVFSSNYGKIFFLTFPACY